MERILEFRGPPIAAGPEEGKEHIKKSAYGDVVPGKAGIPRGPAGAPFVSRRARPSRRALKESRSLNQIPVRGLSCCTPPGESHDRDPRRQDSNYCYKRLR